MSNAKLTKAWTLPAVVGRRDYEVTFEADGSAWRVLCKIGGYGRRGKQAGEGSGRLTWMRGTQMGTTAACAIRSAYQRALRRAESLMDAKPGTPEADELSDLADFCVAYERINYPGRAALQAETSHG